MPLLHGFLLTFGFPWQEFPFLGLWCKRGSCCLFVGIFISFPDILSARKCWLVRLSVMPDFSFFLAGFRLYALKMIQKTK